MNRQTYSSSDRPSLPTCASCLNLQPYQVQSINLFISCIFFPLLSVLFLILTFTSSGGNYWWLKVAMKGGGGEVRIGGVGWCLNDSCQSLGLGYKLSDPPSLRLLPGALVWHLVVVLLTTPLIPINFHFMIHKNKYKWSSLRCCWFWIIPLLTLVLDLSVVVADQLVMKGVTRDEVNVESVRVGGSFWLPIPALIFNSIWFIASIIFFLKSIKDIEIWNSDIDSAKARHYQRKREPEKPPEMGWLGRKVEDLREWRRRGSVEEESDDED